MRIRRGPMDSDLVFEVCNWADVKPVVEAPTFLKAENVDRLENRETPAALQDPMRFVQRGLLAGKQAAAMAVVAAQGPVAGGAGRDGQGHSIGNDALGRFFKKRGDRIVRDRAEMVAHR